MGYHVPTNREFYDVKEITYISTREFFPSTPLLLTLVETRNYYNNFKAAYSTIKAYWSSTSNIVYGTMNTHMDRLKHILYSSYGYYYDTVSTAQPVFGMPIRCIKD